MHILPADDFAVLSNHLFNNILLCISIATVPGVVISVTRAVVIDWMMLMLIPLILPITLWPLWLSHCRSVYRERVLVYLAKPFDTPTLLKQIQTILNKDESNV